LNFETVQKANASGHGNYQGSSHGMEVESMRVMKRWEYDHTVAIAVTDQDSKVAKVIRESRWNFPRESDANHAKRPSTPIAKNIQRRSHSFGTVFGPLSGLISYTPLISF
jgi:hypothetical protein